MMAPAPKVPMFRAVCGLPPSFTRTKNVPAIETTMPTAASTSGSITAWSLIWPAGIRKLAPRIIEPTMEPT